MGEAIRPDSTASVGLLSPRMGVLGKYGLLSQIGRGGMAEVYLAVMLGPGQFSKLIALKVLQSQLAEEPEARVMFLEEARVSARLSHPNIVQTYEVGEEDGRLYIAMEYLKGQPLSRVLYRAKEKSRPF